MKQRLPYRSFFGAALGTLVEYYDYSVLVIFLPLVSPLFFPAASSYDSLIKGFYAMLVAAVARPLGGLFFGSIGDRLGRRKALLCSMYGIAIATILMGLTPSYESIGIWSAIMLTATKAVQLFCFGGEYNGAGIYVVEHAKNKNEAFLGSALTSMMLLGSLLATLIAYVTTLEGMPAWGFRVAFIFGGILGIIGIVFRKNLEESPNFVKADPEKHKVRQLIKAYPAELVAGVFMGGFATVPFTTVIAFINPVLMTKQYLTPQSLMLLQAFLIGVAVLALLIAGRVADKKSPKQVMKIGALALCLLALPLMWLVDTGHFGLIVAAEVGLIVINETLLGPSNACLKNLFAMQYRYRASSLSFTLGLSLFGALTPIVENFLYQLTGSFVSLAAWLIFVGVGAYLSLAMATRKESRLIPFDALG